jgi:hypothetical protein
LGAETCWATLIYKDSDLQALSENFPDSEACYAKSENKPILEKTVAIIEAEMNVSDSCGGEIVLRTSLKDVVPGGATGWEE